MLSTPRTSPEATSPDSSKATTSTPYTWEMALEGEEREMDRLCDRLEAKARARKAQEAQPQNPAA